MNGYTTSPASEEDSLDATHVFKWSESNVGFQINNAISDPLIDEY
jgi:hypothetical protein